ncbi:DUF2705 family protein [Bacillus sp. BS3(2021)]|uniref:DUF2705 family protein n=1 Tax=Bacillus TaxID=1386 RepID=UPI001E43958C|nr:MULTISPECIES: DUF2705 family protein [Bacillus]MCD2368424.1 DUF2705 family protein [Bacillus sp. BS3(2021)]MCJ8229817.1 DUF2705 family protein [Bacillus paralicheniformis]MED1713211.1 DUF2705 family protein [Bacillus paralicheniformis]
MKIKGFLFVVAAIILQAMLMISVSTDAFPFLDGIPIAASEFLILYWYLPIVSLSFYFTGYVKFNLNSYGILKLSRKYSKSKWIVSRYISTMLVLFIFTLTQLFVFYINTIMIHDNQYVFNNNFFKLTIMYYLTLLVLYSIQLLLELFVSPHIAQLIVNIYIVFSLFIAKQLYLLEAPKAMNYFLISNYSNGYRNGLSSLFDIENVCIDYSVAFFILIILQITIVTMSILKVRKMDII